MKRGMMIAAITAALFFVSGCGDAVMDRETGIPMSEETSLETDVSMNLDEGLDEPVSENAEELLELFVAGRVPAHYVEEGRDEFYITDLEMGEEDYFSYAVGERVDLDNDGEKELVLNGPYGGMYLDARNGQVYVLGRGNGTAETLGFTEFDGKAWIVYSDDSHGGRNTYDLYCYDGNGNIADEFQLAKWFWNVAEDEPGTEYEYRGEKIDKEQYDSLYRKIIAPMYTRQKCLYGGEVWGTIESVHREFPEDSEGKVGKVSYYYEMEKFYVRADLPKSDAVNAVLQHIYDNYESGYLENAEWYAPAESEEDLAEGITSDLSEDIQEDLQQDSCEYAKWYLTQLAYAGEDYISLLYNDIAYMGGAHPYSHFDGITIDCRTGMEATAADIVGMEENEILKKVSEEMGLADIATWDEIDFYLTDSEIVFFYRMPGYWDDVVWERK